MKSDKCTIIMYPLGNRKIYDATAVCDPQNYRTLQTIYIFFFSFFECTNYVKNPLFFSVHDVLSFNEGFILFHWNDHIFECYSIHSPCSNFTLFIVIAYKKFMSSWKIKTKFSQIPKRRFDACRFLCVFKICSFSTNKKFMVKVKNYIKLIFIWYQFWRDSFWNKTHL